VFLRAGEVLVERHRSGIEVEEHEAAVALHARRLRQAVIGLLEALRIRVLAGHAVEPAVAVVAPAVVEAGVNLRVAFRLAAHHGAAVAAGIEENAEFVFAVAGEDDGPAADRAGLEVAGRADFGLVPYVDPAYVENPPALELEDLRVHHGCAVDREARGLRIV